MWSSSTVTVESGSTFLLKGKNTTFTLPKEKWHKHSTRLTIRHMPTDPQAQRVSEPAWLGNLPCWGRKGIFQVSPSKNTSPPPPPQLMELLCNPEDGKGRKHTPLPTACAYGPLRVLIWQAEAGALHGLSLLGPVGLHCLVSVVAAC